MLTKFFDRIKTTARLHPARLHPRPGTLLRTMHTARTLLAAAVLFSAANLTCR